LQSPHPASVALASRVSPLGRKESSRELRVCESAVAEMSSSYADVEQRRRESRFERRIGMDVLVPTLRGEVSSRELGRVLMHEHVFQLDEEYRYNYRPDFDEEELIDRAVSEFRALKTAGIDTILDPTVLGLGRFIERVKRVADQVEVNIVPATGLYTYGDLPLPFQNVGPGLKNDIPRPLGAHDDFMVDLFLGDLTEGISGTGIRAGFLKCSIDAQGLTSGIDRVLRAVARAAVETGAPITVHSHAASKNGLVAQRVLSEEGVDLRKVMIGHSGDTTDVDYLMELADSGSILGLDRFGHTGGPNGRPLSLQQRVSTVVALVERGYSDRLVLSHDNFVFSDMFPAGEPGNIISPGLSYLVVPNQVIPALREKGVSDTQIHEMMVDNPRRYFEPIPTA
jgi:phosphotriesterase-related protein